MTQLKNEAHITMLQGIADSLQNITAIGLFFRFLVGTSLCFHSIFPLSENAHLWNDWSLFGVDDHPNGEWMAEFLKALRKNGGDY